MPRYKILIEYDGAPFSGWQYQDNSPSVQRTIMTAIGTWHFSRSGAITRWGEVERGVERHWLGPLKSSGVRRALDPIPRLGPLGRSGWPDAESVLR